MVRPPTSFASYQTGYSARRPPSKSRPSSARATHSPGPIAVVMPSCASPLTHHPLVRRRTVTLCSPDASNPPGFLNPGFEVRLRELKSSVGLTS